MFGLKPELNSGVKIVPGPGAYNHFGSFTSITGSKIGTSKRDDDYQKAKRLGSPGPGTYRHDNTIVHSALKLDAPRFGFGTADKDKNLSVGRVVSPGPGAYEAKKVVGFDGPARSMTARRPMSAGSFRDSPGPGQYTPSRNFSAKVLPKYSIGRE